MANPGRQLHPREAAQLSDETAERVRRNHERRLAELELSPQPIVIKGVFLANGVTTPVAHRRGRPVSVFISPPRRNGAGLASPFIVRVDGSTDPGGADPDQFVTLLAGGWGGTGIRVDLLVF